MAVDTSKVQTRRSLTFHSLQEILADAERISAGPTKILGNWSPGQAFLHLATVMNQSIDGSDVKAPWFIRVVGPLFKKKILSGPMKPGFKLPAAAANVLIPGPTSTEEGLAALRVAITRLENDPKRSVHPVLGALTDEEWLRLHLIHSALHLSFFSPQS